MNRAYVKVGDVREARTAPDTEKSRRGETGGSGVVKLREFQRSFTTMKKKAFAMPGIRFRSEFRPAFQQRTEIGASGIQASLGGHVPPLKPGKSFA